MEKFFSNKNVLIISPESWQRLFVSKHHYAIELSTANKVYFLNPPEKEWSVQKTRFGNIWEINYPPFIPGLRYFPGFLQRFLFRQKMKEIQRRANVTFDVIWSFDNSVFFDFSFLPAGVFTISHIMDFAQNFEMIRAAKSAQICFGVSENIVELLRKNNPHTFLIPHGIAMDRNKHQEVELPGPHKVKAVFAGNLDRNHFDKDILIKLAEANPQADFIFFGSGGKNWERLQNTFYPGVVNSELLNNYLKKADVLLLPYRVEEFPEDLTNSHKVLDYLSSGRTVLSSFLRDYKDQNGLLEMVEKNADFLPAFSKIISNLKEYNSEEAQQKRISFAESNSYKKRMEEIEVHIKDRLSSGA